jgi:GGDEF domain-containing protein
LPAFRGAECETHQDLATCRGCCCPVVLHWCNYDYRIYRVNAQLAEAARLDPLTGLLNRRGLYAEGELEIQRALRSGRDFTLVLAEVDRVARWGGEEFILLLPETNLEGAALLAERLRASVASTRFEFGDESLGVTMTFGIAAYRRGELHGNMYRPGGYRPVPG